MKIVNLEKIVADDVLTANDLKSGECFRVIGEEGIFIKTDEALMVNLENGLAIRTIGIYKERPVKRINAEIVIK